MISIYFLPIFIFFALSSCFRRTEDLTRVPQSPPLRWSTEKLPENFDWTFCHTGACLRHVGIVMEGLVTLRDGDQGYSAEPALAESWSYSDSFTLQINLRKGVFWSDGEPLIADHFVDGWKRLLQKSTGVPSAHLLFSVSGAKAFAEKKIPFDKVGIRVKNAHTILISLTKPSPLFLHHFAHPALWPRREMKANSKLPVTLGAFVVESWLPGSEIHYARNPNYYGKAPRLPAIHVRLAPQASTRVDLFLNRESDFVDGLDAGSLAHVGLPDAIEWFSKPVAHFLIFNVARRPFQTLAAREAFARAISREEWAPLLKWDQLPLTRWWPRFSTPTESRLTFDPEVAKQSLKDALGRPDSNLRYSLAYPPGDITEKLAENLQAQWLKSLETKVELLPTAVYLDKGALAPPAGVLWPSLFLVKLPAGPFDLQAKMSSYWEMVASLTHYHPRAFEEARSSLERATTPEAWNKAMIELETLAVENDLVVFPLTREGIPVLRRSTVQGLSQNAVEFWDFRNTTIVP